MASRKFTYKGKICPKCGSTERYKKDNRCAPCGRKRGKDSSKKWRLNNPELARLKNSKNYHKHKKARDEANRKWRKKHPERARFTRRKTGWKKYGIDLTYEDYKKLYDNQKGECAICSKKINFTSTKSGSRTAKPDHDHKTGKTRGLLCNRCNWDLGIYELRHLEFATYLEKYKD